MDNPQSSKPNRCPVCDSKSRLMGVETDRLWMSCLNNDCWLDGPMRPTADEAVDVWNRLRFIFYPIDK